MYSSVPPPLRTLRGAVSVLLCTLVLSNVLSAAFPVLDVAAERISQSQATPPPHDYSIMYRPFHLMRKDNRYLVLSSPLAPTTSPTIDSLLGISLSSESTAESSDRRRVALSWQIIPARHLATTTTDDQPVGSDDYIIRAINTTRSERPALPTEFSSIFQVTRLSWYQREEEVPARPMLATRFSNQVRLADLWKVEDAGNGYYQFVSTKELVSNNRRKALSVNANGSIAFADAGDAGLPGEAGNSFRLKGDRYNFLSASTDYIGFRPDDYLNARFGNWGTPIPGQTSLGLTGAHVQTASAMVDYILSRNGQHTPTHLNGKPRLVVAHRGLHGNIFQGRDPIPENSIAAIRAAGLAGCEMIELDVKLSADDQLMLMHDYTIGRVVANGRGEPWWSAIRILKNPLVLRDSATGADVTDRGGLDPNPGQDHSSSDLVEYLRTLEYQNPLVSTLDMAELEQYTLKGFRKGFGNGTVPDASHLGEWVRSKERIPSLERALQYVGDTFPGMVVVLDLRHANEVLAATKLIDRMTDAKGVPAREWVWLKPFVNAFPNGFHDLVLTAEKDSVDEWIPSPFNYRWIPVLSGRQVKSAGVSTRSFRQLASATYGSSALTMPRGPDLSRLSVSAVTYLSNWSDLVWSSTNSSDPTTWSTVGNRGYRTAVNRPDKFGILYYELAAAPSEPNPSAAIQELNMAWMAANLPNTQPWRPVDIGDIGVGYMSLPDTAQLGYHFKDDGHGIYPISRKGWRSYLDRRAFSLILTVDVAEQVMAAELPERKGSFYSTLYPNSSTFGWFAYWKN